MKKIKKCTMRFNQKWGNILVLVIFMVANHASSRCCMDFYQRKAPDSLKKLLNKEEI